MVMGIVIDVTGLWVFTTLVVRRIMVVVAVIVMIVVLAVLIVYIIHLVLLGSWVHSPHSCEVSVLAAFDKACSVFVCWSCVCLYTCCFVKFVNIYKYRSHVNNF